MHGLTKEEVGTLSVTEAIVRETRSRADDAKLNCEPLWLTLREAESLLEIDDALERLSRFSPRLAHIVECGMGIRFEDPSPDWAEYYLRWKEKSGVA